jgi:hypothetical protein
MAFLLRRVPQTAINRARPAALATELGGLLLDNVIDVGSQIGVRSTSAR